MDLTSPIRSVIPSVDGLVLAVLAATYEPLNASQVAALVPGPVSRTMVSRVLRRLAESGMVLCDVRPPAKLYRLNRDHVAASGIEALAGQRAELLRRIRAAVDAWSRPPVAVWLFGSAARGDGTVTSDVDLLIIRPDEVDAEDESWTAQLGALDRAILQWSGNRAEVLEITTAELEAILREGRRLASDLRRDAVTLAGAEVRTLLRPQFDGSGARGAEKSGGDHR